MLAFIILWLSFFASVAQAETKGADIALILDSSCSMATNVADASGKTYPPNDPERSSILGALVIEGLLRGGTDGYSVYFLPKDANSQSREVSGAKEIHELRFNGGTYFQSPLKQSSQKLRSSSRRDRLIILLTDGSPSDMGDSWDQQKSLIEQSLGGKNPPFSIFAIGLYKSKEMELAGKQFLEVLIDDPEQNLVLTDDPSKVVPLFMEGFARALGSKPEIEMISSGTEKTLTIPKYVTEVFVAITSDQPKDKFRSAVTSSKGLVSPTASGDNNCSIISNCRYFETYRIPHDPSAPSKMSISVSGSKAPLNYSVIYRYDLQAELEPISSAEVGENVPLRAKLNFQDKKFNDGAFFQADNFQAKVMVGGEEVLLEHVGGGQFEGLFIPKSPKDLEMFRLVISNNWMQQEDTEQVEITGTLDLRLVVGNLDLGSWNGDGSEVEKCAVLDISQSEYADVVKLNCAVENLPKGFKGTCSPSASHPPMKGRFSLYWDVCVTSPPCCAGSENPASVWFRPAEARYADREAEGRVTFVVSETGFWACYWKWIVGTSVGLFLMFLIAGFKRPHDFAEGTRFKVHSKRRRLESTSFRNVEDEIKGRKGFYRNARIAFDVNGEIVSSAKDAVLVVEAGVFGESIFSKAAGLEIYNSSKGKWIGLSEEELKNGFRGNKEYRCQGFYYIFR